MNDFDYDVLQKKRIASGARYKRNGSRSRKCSLPQDTMSAAELKRRNGTMHTYQLGAPMSWKEFKALPDDLKRQYIRSLRDRFNVNAVKLAEMFGVSECYMRGFLRDLGLGEKTHRNMSATQISAWEAFWKDGPEEAIADEEAPEEHEEEENEVMDTQVEISKMPAEKKSGCSINSGILQFTGKAPDIAISLMKFLGDSAYKISVEFSEITEE